MRTLHILIFLMLSTALMADTDSLSITLPETFHHTTENKLQWSDNLLPIIERMHQGDTVNVMMIGDSHVRGNYLPKAVGESLEAAHFTYYGINGAQAYRFLQQDMIDKVREAMPDLLIVSFGTNEAHNARYNADSHRNTLDSLINTYRSINPEMRFLFTTPPGSHISVRSGYYYTGRGKRRRRHWRYRQIANQHTSLVAETLRGFAENKHIALWDLYRISGGTTDACRNWKESGLMAKDGIHFTPEGYKLQGKLLGEAIKKRN